MTVIGEAFIEVKPDSKGFGPETEKSVLASVGSIAKKAGAIIATAFVVKGGANFFKEAIAGASDLGESISKNEVVFGAAADKVLAFGANAAQALGQSNAQALEATGIFGNLLRSVGLTEEKSADFSVTLTGLASDLASFNNTEVDVALDALRAGLTGETEPLKKFGVNMNEAVLKAKALELGLYAGTGALDANAKAQAAYAVILEQTTLAQGDFERTSGGLANQQRILAAQWDDLQAKIGTKFLPAVTAVVKFTNTQLFPAVEKLGTQLQLTLTPAFEGIRDVIEQLSAGNLLPSLAVELGKMVGLAEDHPAVTALASSFEAVAGAASTVIGAVRNVASRVISEIGDRLSPVIDGAKDAWIAYRDEGVGPIAEALDGIKGLIDGMSDAIERNADVLLPAAAAAATFVGALLAIQAAAQGIAALKLGLAATSFAVPLIAAAGPIGLIAAGLLAIAAAGVVAYLKIEPFRAAVDATARVIADVAVKAFERGRDAIQELGGVFEGVADLVTGVFDTIDNVADFGAIFGGITDAVGGLAGQVAGLDFSGIFDGISDSVGEVADTVIEALGPIIEWLEDELVPVFEAAFGFFDALFERLVQVIGPFVEVYVSGLKLVTGLIKDGLVAALKVAGPIVSAVLNQMAAVFRTIAAVAIPAFLLAVDSIGFVVSTVFNSVLAIIEGVLQTIQGLFQVGEGILRGDFSKIWEGLENIVRAPFEAIEGIITGSFNRSLEFIRGLPGKVVDAAAGIWDELKNTTQTAFDDLKGIVTGTFDAIIELVRGLPDRLLEHVEVIGSAALELGAAIIDKLFEGLGALGEKTVELSAALLASVESLGKTIINGIIDAMNDMLPNSIGKVEVKGVTIFPGLDLPDDPIPRLAAGGIIPATPGGIVARIGEGSSAEGVFPLPPGVLQGLTAIGRNGGSGQPVFGEGAIQVVAPDTPAALIVNDVMAKIGWQLSIRSDF